MPLAQGDHVLKVIATSAAGVKGKHQVTMRVDNSPELEILSPKGGSAVKGNTLTITGHYQSHIKGTPILKILMDSETETRKVVFEEKVDPDFTLTLDLAGQQPGGLTLNFHLLGDGEIEAATARGFKLTAL